jgi:glycosyltransferase involved in cell wall biosynthesis
MDDNAVRLSVVIPTFNNLPVLQRCLDAWRRYGCSVLGTVEVIVIEDGCRDGTQDFLAELEHTELGKRWLRWFHEEDAHELVCTNRGLAAAKGSLILAWQDDMILNDVWLVPELLQTFDAYPELGLLSLSRGLLCLPLQKRVERWEDLHDPRRLQSYVGPRLLNWFRLQEVDIVIRPWVVRRKCIKTVGLLDEAFRPTEWDEADLCLRIRQAGWKIGTHAYERLGAYAHLGSTTLNFSATYKAKVLRNGQLFHERWDDMIKDDFARPRIWWHRRATIQGWISTFGRLLKFACILARHHAAGN